MVPKTPRVLRRGWLVIYSPRKAIYCLLYTCYLIPAGCSLQIKADSQGMVLALFPASIVERSAGGGGQMGADGDGGTSLGPPWGNARLWSISQPQRSGQSTSAPSAAGQDELGGDREGDGAGVAPPPHPPQPQDGGGGDQPWHSQHPTTHTFPTVLPPGTHIPRAQRHLLGPPHVPCQHPRVPWAVCTPPPDQGLLGGAGRASRGEPGAAADVQRDQYHQAAHGPTSHLGTHEWEWGGKCPHRHYFACRGGGVSPQSLGAPLGHAVQLRCRSTCHHICPPNFTPPLAPRKI